MGFFRRLRAGSTTSQPSDAGSTSGPVSPGASTLNGPNSPSSAYFPTSSSSPRTYATSSPHDRTRPAVLPSSSSSSITSKISRNPWKKKGKSKEDAVAGPSYESTPPRSPVAEDPRTNHGPGRVAGKRDTMVFIGPGAARGSANGGNPPVGSSPASAWGRSVTPPNISHIASSLHSFPRSEISLRKNRIPSEDFGQDGGILGRLGFEAEAAQGKDQLWIDTTPRRPSVSVRKEVVDEAVFVEKEEGSALHTKENGVGKMEEEVEVLESAEKKQKFWKGRIRRASRAASDSEDEQPGSPTPRKTTFPVNTAHPSNPVTRSSVDLSQPRPQQLRRPSSSLFHNPFARSVSRTSLHQLELDAPVVAAQDDKSFQLKAFRHISGTSDVEGAGGLEGYLSHVPRESMIGLDMSHNPSSPIEPSSPSRLPPSAYSSGPRPRAPSRGQLTRPPSVAASLASIDDLGSSNRISAAAFRKGIRRPSEGAALAVDDDDDDVPLGMINRPRQMSRNQSALSLSSLQEATRQKQGQDEVTGMSGALVVDVAGSTPSSVQHDLASRATPSPRPSSSPRPSPSPSPGPGYPVKRVTPGGRFVVKGVTSSRDVRPGFDRQTSSGQASSYSIPRSASQSPSPSLGRLAAAAPILDETEIIQSPTEMEHQTSHSAVSSHAPKHTRTTSWFEVNDERHNEDHVIRLNDSPVRDSPIRPAPPVGPISLPERGNTSPSLNDLPLPPDLMPDTPPKSDKALAEDGATSTSPGKARRVSLLEEPLRAISGLWSPSSRDTGPDATARPGPHPPDLSRSIMDQPAVLQAVAKQEGLSDPPVKSVLFDGTPSVSPVTDRSPLSVRLAKAAELSAQARSVNPSASAIKDQVKPQENWMPPDLSPTTLTHFVDQQESKVSQLAPKVEDPPTSVEDEEPEIVSSFVRARPAMRQRMSSNKAEPKVVISPVASAAPLSVEPESPQSSFRPPPSPRLRSSLANGRNADAESSESDTESDTSIKAKPKQSSRSRRHPMGPRQRAVSISKPDDDSSSEEESLAVLRARASRSSLALHKIPSHPSPAGPPVTSLPGSPLLTGSSLPGGRSAMPASAPESPRKTVRSLAPHGRGVRHTSSSVPPVKSPLGQDSRLPCPDIGGTGSPASSSQSATSESQVQGPMTPRDAASLRRDSLAETKQPQGRPDETRERRQSHFSQQGYFDNQIAAPTHGMEQASMM